MKVKELIEKLNKFNPEADVFVNAHSKNFSFTIAYGGFESATKMEAYDICFYVDELNNSESESK